MQNSLYQKCQDYQADYVKLWEQLVNIDTGTGYGEGLVRMGGIVLRFLEELGAEIKTVDSDTPGAGFNIIATFSGQGTGSVLAMAHLDTVFPPGTAAKRPFRIEGEWAYGPGVSDCKGSVALCLFALKLLQETRYGDYGKITCLFNCDEEIGSPSSRDLIQRLTKEHDYVLCCEPGQFGDGVVLSRKGSAVLKVEVHGRASHAGNAPQDGRNAIMEMTHQIRQMSALENPAKLTTLNFTTIQGGDRNNVIPDYAVATADVRVAYPEELDRIEQAARTIAQQKAIPDTRVEVTLIRHNPPFPRNESTDALIATAQQLYGEIGKTLLTNAAGGASDANWAAAAGATVIDGLGPVKGGINHTDKERTAVASVAPRLYLLSRLFMELGRKG
ncbi:MAG TPA: glutamate carboxypeptidase [Selenomonadales bacterium]|nr:glutamate carboxypeptidase [Selenomonadales bacterium]